MLLITGTIRLSSVEALQRATAGLAARAARSRQDAGCLDYQFSVAVDDPSEIRLVERWASQEDLDAHLAVPDPEFSALLAEAEITSAVVELHEVAGSREMMRR